MKKILQTSPRKSLKYSELVELVIDNKENELEKENKTPEDYIDEMYEAGIVDEIELEFPNRKYLVYVVPASSIYVILSGINKDVYYSHLSAMYLNNLVNEEPDKIIVNYEQSKKNFGSSSLEQGRINYAFGNKPKVSKNILELGGKEIFLINGKNTNNLGVVQKEYNNEGLINYTDIERTLIDIAVRPIYSGGVKNIIKAYSNAAGKFSIRKLKNYLAEINHAYPYHQAIGFYINRTQPNNKEVEQLKELGMKYEFYLDYNMKEKNYSKDWKIYYPKEIDEG